MVAYNELSGVPAVINPDIQKVLKDRWGLGFVVTDGGDVSPECNVPQIQRIPRRNDSPCDKERYGRYERLRGCGRGGGV